jgi:hypothetical protein
MLRGMEECGVPARLGYSGGNAGADAFPSQRLLCCLWRMTGYVPGWTACFIERPSETTTRLAYRLLVFSQGLGMFSVLSVGGGMNMISLEELLSGAGWLNLAIADLAVAILDMAGHGNSLTYLLVRGSRLSLWTDDGRRRLAGTAAALAAALACEYPPIVCAAHC